MIAADFVRAAVKAPVLVAAAHEYRESKQRREREADPGAPSQRRQAPPHRPDEQQEYRNAENEKRGVRADCGEKPIGGDEGAEDSPSNVDAVGAAGVSGIAARILVDQPRCQVAKGKTEGHDT